MPQPPKALGQRGQLLGMVEAATWGGAQQGFENIIVQRLAQLAAQKKAEDEAYKRAQDLRAADLTWETERRMRDTANEAKRQFEITSPSEIDLRVSTAAENRRKPQSEAEARAAAADAATLANRRAQDAAAAADLRSYGTRRNQADIDAEKEAQKFEYDKTLEGMRQAGKEGGANKVHMIAVGGGQLAPYTMNEKTGQWVRGTDAATGQPIGAAEDEALARSILQSPRELEGLNPTARTKVLTTIAMSGGRLQDVAIDKRNRQIDDTLETVNQLLNPVNPAAFTSAVGSPLESLSQLGGWWKYPIEGSDAADYVRLITRVRQQLTANEIDTMRGLGPMSDADREFLTKTQTILNSRLSEQAFVKELQRLRTGLLAIRANYQRAPDSGGTPAAAPERWQPVGTPSPGRGGGTPPAGPRASAPPVTGTVERWVPKR